MKSGTFTEQNIISYSPPEIPTDTINLRWQMTRAERLAFQNILNALKPRIALEVGTDEGGSLQAIMQYATAAISIDINMTNQMRLKKLPCFANVEFVVGNSNELLPDLVSLINLKGLGINFILIDGDHSTVGMSRDLEAVLEIEPQETICILMHDSFMPSVRRAILNVDWQAYPHVHYIEVDYTPGCLLPWDQIGTFKLVGGLAVVLLKPFVRSEPLNIYQSHNTSFNALLPLASNNW